MNTPVNFELAKLLKEKGFDEPCTHHFLNNEDVINFGSRRKSKEILENLDVGTQLLALPTIAEVVMWLYQKHGIWVYTYKIEPFVYDDFPYLKQVWISKCDDKFIDSHNGLAINHHQSPTEAYLAAIEYTLENIK